MTDDLIIRIEDIRKTGHCVAGIRQWFRAYDLDFAAFLQDGIPASTLLATGDTLAQKVVNSARESVDG